MLSFVRKTAQFFVFEPDMKFKISELLPKNLDSGRLLNSDI